MAVKVMFGFETGLKTDYWAWTGTHYVSSGDPMKVLPAWSNAQARTGGWSAQMAAANEQIEFDPLMELPDRCWYTFGIRFSSVTPGSDSLFLQIRNQGSAILDVLLTPQSKVRVVRSGGGGGGGQGVSDITSNVSVVANQWHLIQIELDFNGVGPSSAVQLYIDGNAPDVSSTTFTLDAAPREARFVHSGIDYFLDDVYINDKTGRCTDIKPRVEHYGILLLSPAGDVLVQNFTDGGTDLFDEIDEVPWPAHSPDPPCEDPADAAQSTPNQVSKLVVSLDDPPQQFPIGVSALIESKEQHASTVFEFGVELSGAEEVNAINDAIVCWLSSAAMFAGDPKGFPWTLETVEALNMVFKTDGGPDRFTIEAAAVEFAYSIPAEVVEVYPVDTDFSAGDQGKVMISALHGGGYHTTALTAVGGQNGKPAQTEPAEVVISAYVSPVEAGITIYFEVIDPDDPVDNNNSAYKEDITPLTPFGTTDAMGAVDSNPNDHRDPATGPSKSMFGGTLAKYNDYQDMLTARSATTIIAQIGGQQRAVAETTLRFTKRYAGDNYIVRATCVDPLGKPFNDDSGVTADPDADAGIPAGHIQETTVLTAWKRVYVETDKMFRMGADLTQDAAANQNVVFCDTSGLNLEVDDFVQILDTDNQLSPFGEVMQVEEVQADRIILTDDLSDSYETAKKAHVGKVIDANDANFKPFYEADTSELETLWAEAFVEVFLEDEGSGPCPFKPDLDWDDQVTYSNDWFSHNDPNYFHIIGGHKEGTIPESAGTTWDAANASFVWVQRIEDLFASETDRESAKRAVTAHEFTHQFDDDPAPPEKHHTSSQPGVVPVADHDCIMYPDRDARDPVRWCIFHVYTVRDEKDPR